MHVNLYYNITLKATRLSYSDLHTILLFDDDGNEIVRTNTGSLLAPGFFGTPFCERDKRGISHFKLYLEGYAVDTC